MQRKMRNGRGPEDSRGKSAQCSRTGAPVRVRLRRVGSLTRYRATEAVGDPQPAAQGTATRALGRAQSLYTRHVNGPWADVCTLYNVLCLNANSLPHAPPPLPSLPRPPPQPPHPHPSISPFLLRALPSPCDTENGNRPCDVDGAGLHWSALRASGHLTQPHRPSVQRTQ